METAAMFELAPEASLALKVNPSAPLYPDAGVYVRSGALPERTPCDGPLTTSNVNPPPSTSVAINPIATSVSYGVVTFRSSATGASFTEFTVIETVAMFESVLPSFALNVNESPPFQFAAGV
jgi:hypothetical protein